LRLNKRVAEYRRYGAEFLFHSRTNNNNNMKYDAGTDPSQPLGLKRRPGHSIGCGRSGERAENQVSTRRGDQEGGQARADSAAGGDCCRGCVEVAPPRAGEVGHQNQCALHVGGAWDADSGILHLRKFCVYQHQGWYPVPWNVAERA